MADHSDQEIRAAANLGLPNEMTRFDVEMAIARLIELLDSADDDVDLEFDDREVDDCDLEDDEDDDTSADEPLLGSVDSQENQSFWAEGYASDLECDDSDDEPGADEEPSLAAPENNGDQTSWNRGGDTDREATDTIEDLPIYSTMIRSRADIAELLQIEAAAHVLARRLRGRRSAKPRRRVDPPWMSGLRRAR